MKIEGSFAYGGTNYDNINITADTVEEFNEAVNQLVESAPAHFEKLVKIQQAAVAAEILTKPAAAAVERTKSSPPPKAAKGGKEGCRHGAWTVFEEGKYQHTHYCPGPKDDKCSFKELQAAGVR